MQAAGPPVTGQVWRFITFAIPGDLDLDLDVDQDDFGRLQACLSELGQPTPAGCETGDLNGDGGVSKNDLPVFLSCMSGANVDGNLTCAD